MIWINQAIRILTDPNDPNDQSIKDYEREVLRKYYAENKAAHREYLEKGIYDELPEMQGFRTEMETIEKILSEHAQMKLF